MPEPCHVQLHPRRRMSLSALVGRSTPDRLIPADSRPPEWSGLPERSRMPARSRRGAVPLVTAGELAQSRAAFTDT